MKRIFTFIFVISFLPISGQNNSVVINEFMSSNSTTIADEDGDYSDWIELYNPTNEAVNLEGWGLSDNEEKPFKWVFPNVTIEPDEYKVIFASGKDRTPTKGSTKIGITHEFYKVIVTNTSSFVDNYMFYPHMSSNQTITNYVEAPRNQGNYYGQRLHSFFIAPQTGNYTFWLACDDAGVLNLSSDENPKNVSTIAYLNSWAGSRVWDKYESQQSEEIYLEEGKKYYLSAISIQGTGGDNLSVGWQLPDGTLERPIPASYFSSYVSDEQHTNFSISSDGEPLILTNKDGETVHYVQEVELSSDVSYGLENDNGSFSYFTQSTPGKENNTLSYPQLSLEEVQFSHKGGFYSDEFQLTLSVNNPNAQIYYTLDGSEPSPNNLDGTEYSYAISYPFGLKDTDETKTYLYTAPIEIKDKSNNPYQLAKITTYFGSNARLPIDNIFKGTVVRAVAIDNDVFYATVSGNSYFITNEGIDRYDLPVVSVISDPIGLFDYEKGIYVPGRIADDWVQDNPLDNFNPNSKANYKQKGKEWERRASYNYFDKQNNYINNNIGIRIHGNYTRAVYKKSLRIYSRGNRDEEFLNYSFFQNLKSKIDTSKSIESFKRILLRNSGNDYAQTLYKDALIHQLSQKLPFATQAYRPIIHFVNGEYWGIINLRERYDEYFISSHFGIDTDDVAILKHNSSIDIGDVSDQQNFVSIINFAQRNDLTLPENYEIVNRQIHIESMLQSFAAEMFVVNTDWPHNNQRYWKYRKGVYSEDTPMGLDGRWSWMMYDTDHGFGFGDVLKYKNNEFVRVLSGQFNSQEATMLFREILTNENAQRFFINIIADQINSCFKSDWIFATVDQFNARLASSRAEHYNRWQSGIDEGESIKTFAQERPAYVRQHTREHFNLGDDYDVVVSRVGNGEVKINTIQINSELPGVSNPAEPYPWSGKYFGGVPIKLKAVETDNSLFSYWEGDVPNHLKYDKEIEIEINENSSFIAVFEEVKRDLIHYWHFNDLGKNELDYVEADESKQVNSGYILYPGIGDGYMDRVKEGTDINSQNGAEDGNALRVRNPSDTRSLEISIPTNGYESIKINYAITRTSKGAPLHSIYYKTDWNEEPILFRENVIINETFRVVELDFSSILEANNNENFNLVIKFEGEEASGDSGNTRFDNITVTGISLSGSTEISNVDNYSKLNVYPNPVKDNINITSVDKINDIQIVDINGRVVLYEFVDNYHFTKNISFLEDGIYILQIKCDSGVKMKKIVKNM